MSESDVRRPDASMDLLNDIRRDALEPGYGSARREDARQQVRRPVVVITLTVIGFLGGLALATTMKSAPVAASERAELLSRIRQVEGELDAKQARIAEMVSENEKLESEASGLGREELDRLRSLSALTGAQPVTGPGLVITVDDGPDSDKLGSQVVDVDLRQLVNSLWESGAEAIGVNGHRMSSRTSIRAAGEAITVGYRSISGPYVVTAIGDPNQLRERFMASPGAAWWNSLSGTYGMRFDVKKSDTLHLSGDTGLGVARAVSGTGGGHR